MKTNVIEINNAGNGYQEAVELVEKTAANNNLTRHDKLQLQLLTEEMMSLAMSITGEMTANFWIENDNNHYELHMTTHTKMDAEKRSLLISSSSTKKNEAANTFLGKLRNIIEESFQAKPDFSHEYSFSQDMMSDLPPEFLADKEWDGYERSVLLKTADEVKVSIKGGNVEICVVKKF